MGVYGFTATAAGLPDFNLIANLILKAHNALLLPCVRFSREISQPLQEQMFLLLMDSVNTGDGAIEVLWVVFYYY